MGGGPGGMDCESDISFVMDIKPIIDTKCIMCHDGSQPIPDFRTYQVIKNNAAKVKELTAAKIMPQTGTLTDAQIKHPVVAASHGTSPHLTADTASINNGAAYMDPIGRYYFVTFKANF